MRLRASAKMLAPRYAVTAIAALCSLHRFSDAIPPSEMLALMRLRDGPHQNFMQHRDDVGRCVHVCHSTAHCNMSHSATHVLLASWCPSLPNACTVWPPVAMLVQAPLACLECCSSQMNSTQAAWPLPQCNHHVTLRHSIFDRLAVQGAGMLHSGL
jgi:hypothetical protein